MPNPYKRLTYKQNKYNQSILEPVVYLCSRNLEKIGRLYPVNDINIVTNFNAANEISFSFYSEVNGKKCNFYNQLEDLSVIQIENHKNDQDMFFECAVTEKDNVALYKSVSGISLGYAEISQKLVTLDVNTENDITYSDQPSILYKENDPNHSILDRILSFSPDYEIGHVDDTIACLQRTFSWSDASIDSCFNDICEELECIYTIDVKVDKDTGKVIRKVNFYDLCYCMDCWERLQNKNGNNKTSDYWKNIVNGECQTCGSKNIYDIGEDTTITINTKNLTDDIQIQTDKEKIKNCFKLKAGDDTLTNMIGAVNPSGTDEIIMFSDEQINMFSKELKAKWNAYLKKINDVSLNKNYSHLNELHFNILDLIKYLETEKMPTHETEHGTIDDQWEKINDGLLSYGYKFYSAPDAASKIYDSKITIRNFISSFLNEGYEIIANTNSVSDKYSEWTSPITATYFCRWFGTYKIYKISDRDTYILVTVHENGQTVEIHHGKDGVVDTINETQTYYKIYDGKESLSYYTEYLKQHLASLLRDEKIYDFSTSNWNLYSVSRLNSFYDGYSVCIETLDMLAISQQSVFDDKSNEQRNEIIDKLKENYKCYLSDISKIRDILEDQIFSLYYVLGDIEKLKEKYPPLNNSQDYNYSLKHFTNVGLALLLLQSSDGETVFNCHVYDQDGNVTGSQNLIVGFTSGGDKPVQCLNCGSTNIQPYYSSFKCMNCGNDYDDKIVTYRDYSGDIYEWYKDSSTKNLLSEIRSIQESLSINSDENLGVDLYKELCSYIRQDVYTNSNFISDGLASNTELIKNIKEFISKAKRELAVACTPQISITADIGAVVVLDSVKPQNLSIENAYDKFKLGNFIRVIVNNHVYRLRVISIQYPYDTIERVQPTFSNVTKSAICGVESDIKSIISQAKSMSSSFSSVQHQAQKGEIASHKFETIKNEGLNSAIGFVTGASNQNVTIDDKGITCRYYNKDYDVYSDEQLRIINGNIVLTKDNWNTASMAIGKGLYNGMVYYGVWADLLVGDLMVAQDLKILNKNTTVEINENGIILTGGAITWRNPEKLQIPQEGISGLKEHFDQLDGRIETFSQSTDPSVDWKTTDEKNKHKGDLWFNQTDGLTKQWNGNTWITITDSKLNELAKSKATVFTSTPTVPYQEGDLWVQGENGDIMRCNISRSTGYYAASDWVKASKYTDDSYAKQVEEDYTKEINDFKTDVKDYLGIGSTHIDENHVISPYLGGGLLYIANTNENDKRSVLIDPLELSENNKIFQITNKSGTPTLYADSDGNTYFSGEINVNNRFKVDSLGNVTLPIGTKITWGDVTGTDDIATISGIENKGYKNEQQITEITKNMIKTEKIEATNLTISGDSSFAGFKVGDHIGQQVLMTESWSNSYRHLLMLSKWSIDLSFTYQDADSYREIASFRVDTMGGSNNNNMSFNGSGVYFTADEIEYTADKINLLYSNTNFIKIKNNIEIKTDENVSILAKESIGLNSQSNITLTASEDIKLNPTKNLLINGSPIATTSDKRKKKNITDLSSYEEFYMKINPVAFKYIDGQSDRYHIGFISQQIKHSLEITCKSSNDFGGYVYDSNEDKYYLRYEEFIALNTHMVQKLFGRIEELENRIKELEK